MPFLYQPQTNANRKAQQNVEFQFQPICIGASLGVEYMRDNRGQKYEILAST